MRRVIVLTLFAACCALAASGCGGGGSGGGPSASAPPATSTPAATPPAPVDTTPVPTVSRYDDGPRAGTKPVDATLAAVGEKLFQTRGCTVCHGFGKKITCPDLVGVSMRRTALWMEQQILHPEVMVKEDPIAHALKKEYPLPMTNQGVKPDEARALIEFLKKKDKDAGVKPS